MVLIQFILDPLFFGIPDKQKLWKVKNGLAKYVKCGRSYQYVNICYRLKCLFGRIEGGGWVLILAKCFSPMENKDKIIIIIIIIIISPRPGNTGLMSSRG